MAAKTDPNRDTGFAAFISYAHHDEQWAKWLHRALETYRLPTAVAREQSRKRLGRVFLDRSELATSASLSDRIAEALTESANLVVVCSPAARASRWVNEEIRRFRALGRGDRIFCLIIDGDPARSDDEGCFPPALLMDLHDVASIEPLAADVRPGKDRRPDARLKLLAGLFDLPFDALRRREQVRRQRILAIVAAVSIGLLAVLSVLTVFVLLSRADAVRQRDTAEETAIFLRQLLLRADPGTAMGREVTVREVVAAAELQLLRSSEFARQPEVKASLLVTLAEVDVRLRLIAEGARLITAADALSPRDPLTRVRIAVADAGLRSWQNDNPGLRRALDQCFALLAGNPELAEDYRAPLLGYRAQLAQAENRLEDAMRDWAELRTVLQAARTPDRDNIIAALIGESSAAIAAGKLDRAQPLLERAVAMRTAMGQTEHPSVLKAINELGAIAAKRGDMASAERQFRRAIELQQRIQGPGSLDAAYSRNNLGRALVEQRRFAEAIKELDAARQTIVAQAGAGVTAIANLEDSTGLALGGQGKPDAARAAFDRGLVVARANAMPKEIELLSDRAELDCGNGAIVGGLAQVAQARATLKRFGLPEPWRGARIDAVEAGCHLAAGRKAAAQTLIVRAMPLVVARWGRASLFGRSVRLNARAAGLTDAATAQRN